jgi:hypothetical protein
MPPIAQIMLANQAGLQTGTLQVRGGGWSVRSANAENMAVAVILLFSRDEMGQHQAHLELRYAGGDMVQPKEMGGYATSFDYGFNVRGLEEPALATPLVASFVVNLPPVPLPAGQEYLWQLSVDGQTRDDWIAPFRVGPPWPQT